MDDDSNVYCYKVRNLNKFLISAVSVIFILSFFLVQEKQQWLWNFETIKTNIIVTFGSVFFIFFAMKVIFTKYIIKDNKIIVKKIISRKSYSVLLIKTIEVNHHKLTHICLYLNKERKIKMMPIQEHNMFIEKLKEVLDRNNCDWNFIESKN